MPENINTMVVQLNVGDLRKIISEEVFYAIENSGIHKEEESVLDEDHNEIMDVKDVCKLLKIEAPTLYKKTSEKSIPFYKTGGKLTFSRKEIQKWLLSGKILTASERNEISHEILIQKNKTRLSK